MKGWKNPFWTAEEYVRIYFIKLQTWSNFVWIYFNMFKKDLHRLSYHFSPYCKGTKAWKHAFYFQAHKQLLTEIVQIQHSISVSQTLKQGRLVYIMISLYNINKHQSWILLDLVSTHFLICWNIRVLDILKNVFF